MSSTHLQAEIGPVLTGADVEAAVLNTLRAWLPSYLAEGERAKGLEPGALPLPRGWLVTGRDLQKYTSDQLPCIVVMTGGVILKPLKQGYPGATTAVFNVDVGTIFNAAWGSKSRVHAQLYVRMMALTLVQRPLEGLPCAVDFVGENYDELDFSDTRTYSAAVAAFTLEVENVLWAAGGPPPYVTPPDDPLDPFDPWTTVTEVDVSVDNTSP
jgi:hypothetical protein